MPVLIVVLGALTLWATAVLVIVVQVEAECYKHGYRDGTITWNFDAYCMKRVDQTDVVVPLESLQ